MGMRIISLENRKGVRLGDVIEVAPGLGRHLIAKERAVRNTPANQEKFIAMRAALEKREIEIRKMAEERAKCLQALSIRIASRAADDIRLYGSLGTRDIANALSEAADMSVEKHEIRLPAGPIRHLGMHEIEVQLHSEIKISLAIQVIAGT
jgi:large subunit ribosomal protein L9